MSQGEWLWVSESGPVGEQVVDLARDLLLPDHGLVDGPAVPVHCRPVLLQHRQLLQLPVHLQRPDAAVVALEGLPQLPRHPAHALPGLRRRLLPLSLARGLDHREQLLPAPHHLQHRQLHLVDHQLQCATPTQGLLIQVYKLMLRATLRVGIFRCSTTPVLKRSHQFNELELRQLLSEPNELREAMVEQLRETGELSVGNYWKQALTDDRLGYYRQQNVFAKEGDFITAPEISSLFGEMVATWLAVFLQHQKVGVLNALTNAVEKPFRLVELGGGRGMLMQDVLRSFHSYRITNHFQLCFIEISEYNRKEQQRNVLEEFKKNKTFFRFDYEKATPLREEFIAENEFKEIRLKWFSKLEDLVKEDYEAKQNGKELPITIFLMNEFFDALPISVIEYTQAGWREKVLKLTQNPQFPFALENSSHPLHPKLVPNVEKATIGDRLQISPESYIAMDMMARMISMTGGAILNIDYGGNGPFVDSIRAIKNHKYIPAPHYWQIPGVCDLSAHVAFSPLAQYAERVEGVKAFELIPQQFFLEAMGIEARVDALSKGATKERLERLQGQAKRLTSPEEMGDFFKVQIISLKEYGEIYPHVTYNPNVF